MRVSVKSRVIVRFLILGSGVSEGADCWGKIFFFFYLSHLSLYIILNGRYCFWVLDILVLKSQQAPRLTWLSKVLDFQQIWLSVWEITILELRLVSIWAGCMHIVTQRLIIKKRRKRQRSVNYQPLLKNMNKDVLFFILWSIVSEI